MSTSDEKNPAVEPEEESFVRRALAKVDKTERFHRIREIAITVLVFPAAYYLAGRAPYLPVPFAVSMIIGVLLIAVTNKITGLIRRNTTLILRAIADIDRK